MERTKKTLSVAALLAAAVAAMFGPEAHAAGPPPPQKQTISSEVATRGTKWDGKRYTATSRWTSLTAPVGYIINEKLTKVRVMSAHGSAHSYDLEYRDEVPLFPGHSYKAPRTVRVRTYARSPKGKFHGERGWMEVEVDVFFTKLP